MINEKKLQSGKTKLRVNLIIVIAGIISIFLTKYIIETKRQNEIREIGYKINGYRTEIRQMKSMNAKLNSELEKIKKPVVIMSMLRKYGIKLNMPNLEKTITISLSKAKAKK